jgi:epoxide hydrolase-like predicted phosphatase
MECNVTYLQANTQANNPLLKRTKIKNIIFDLGGVIMNIEPAYTFRAFASMSNKSADEIREIYQNTTFFRQYETGKIDDKSFRNGIRKALLIDSPDEDIDAAWNALLLEIPAVKIEMLKSARNRFRTFLLSNTNNIHRKKFEQVIESYLKGDSIHTLFEKVYYSYLMEGRKPDPGIFESVLKENNLNPSETLMIDDNTENIETARSLGMKVMEVTLNQKVIEIPEN